MLNSRAQNTGSTATRRDAELGIAPGAPGGSGGCERFQHPGGLIDLLEDGVSGNGEILFLPDERTVKLDHLWSQAHTAARYIGHHCPDRAIAVVLTSTPSCLATLLGGWLAGKCVASLPLPRRTQDLADYSVECLRMSQAVGATTLFAEDPSLLQGFGGEPTLRSYDEVSRGGPRRAVVDDPSFVQFTSGTTGLPKGVELSASAMGAQLQALLEVLIPDAGNRAVSWLPLSHDMGLFGMCLTPWALAAPRFAGEVVYALIRPEAYIANPSLWLRTCSDIRATTTTAPSAAFEFSARNLHRTPDLDLSSLRSCIVGAEQVQAETLRRFARSAEPNGFNPTAFCPAYGMAEATLAVTMTRPAEHWRSITVDAVQLGEGVVEQSQNGQVELVSTGGAVPGLEVDTGGTLGPIRVRGESMFSGYVDGHRLGAGEWLKTKDLGFIDGGNLYVTGRTDDLLLVRGRNIYATHLEATLVAHEGINPGSCVAVPDDRGGFRLVIERRRAEAYGDPKAQRQMVQWARTALATEFDAAPSSATVVGPGDLPRTPSGKVRRAEVLGLCRSEGLDTELHLDFSGSRDK